MHVRATYVEGPRVQDGPPSATRVADGGSGPLGGVLPPGRDQPLARACTRLKSPLKVSWSPGKMPLSAYCQIVW